MANRRRLIRAVLCVLACILVAGVFLARHVLLSSSASAHAIRKMMGLVKGGRVDKHLLAIGDRKLIGALPGRIPAALPGGATPQCPGPSSKCPADGRWRCCGNRTYCRLFRACATPGWRRPWTIGEGRECGCAMDADWVAQPSWVRGPPTRSERIAAVFAEIARDTPAVQLEDHGYYAIRDGWVHMDFLGTHMALIGLWDGGNQLDLDALLIPLSKRRPHTTFVVCRGDSGDGFAALTPHHRQALLDAGVVVLVASLSQELSERLAPLVRVLPTPWTDDFYEGRAREVSEATQGVPLGARTAKCVWRGVTSGTEKVGGGNGYSAQYRKCEADRVRGTHCGTRLSVLDALQPPTTRLGGSHDPRMAESSLVDVGFSRSDLMGKWDRDHPHLLRPAMDEEAQAGYQCILVLDGWGWPGNLHWVLNSGSVPLVAANIYTGFQHELTPNVHYIPLALNGAFPLPLCSTNRVAIAIEPPSIPTSYYTRTAFELQYIYSFPSFPPICCRARYTLYTPFALPIGHYQSAMHARCICDLVEHPSLPPSHTPIPRPRQAPMPPSVCGTY